ncbi:MAG: phytanoyl-CoA dioxygenase family protein [Labilithrix sp.]|nr:phytanoyl-CoA dioxygenase family protein [Labilithrix sp.]
MDVFELLTPRGLATLAPSLGVGRAQSTTGFVARARPDAAESLNRRGWLELELADASSCERLVEACERLHAEQLPPVALYAFDEVWELGRAVRDGVTAALGTQYELIEDLWAFRVPPGSAGWPPHRGVYRRLGRQQPEYVNTWVALSDASLDRSCMHFVPLDVDARYRAHAEELTDDHEPRDAVAVPIPQGVGLAWNANVLHWGGACAPTAAGPRRSITFTLSRSDALERADLGSARVVRASTLEPWRRLEVIARQILLYGPRDPDVTDAVREWARITVEMADRLAAPR